MESEKVKEIKKALEDNANYEHHNKLGYIDGYKCKTVAYADILTLINELESENELLRNAKVVYENVDYCAEDLKKAQDRIDELEKENANLLDSVETVQSNRCVYKCVLTKEHLTKFVEMLKEKLKDNVNAENVDIFVECIRLINETLKGFINE